MIKKTIHPVGAYFLLNKSIPFMKTLDYER